MIALLVYLESGRPVFYTDWRMGKDGVPFPCIKFRTMVPGAEAVLELMLAEDAGLREEYVKNTISYASIPVLRASADSCAGQVWMSCRSFGTSCAGR